MLDVSNATTIIEQWTTLESQAVLVVPREEFFAPVGPKPEKKGCHRNYERHFMRCKAILQQECEKHAIYIKDCSRTGMGIISPVQLFPKQRVQVWIDEQRSYQLEIARCRKRGPNCYECGTVFILN